jgi:hypothetical protein
MGTLSALPAAGSLKVAVLLDSGSSVSCISSQFLEALTKIGLKIDSTAPQSLATPGTQLLTTSQAVRAHLFFSPECSFEENFVVVPMLEHVIVSWSVISAYNLFALYHSRTDLRAPLPGTLSSNAISFVQPFSVELELFKPVLQLPVRQPGTPASECEFFRPILTLPSPSKIAQALHDSNLTNRKNESVNFFIGHNATTVVADRHGAFENSSSHCPTSPRPTTMLSGGRVDRFAGELEATLGGDVVPEVQMAILDTSSPAVLQRVTDLADKYTALFDEKLPPEGASVPPFHIDLIPNSAPLLTKFRRTSPVVAEKVEAQVKELLSSGLIERTDATFVSPTLLVRKGSSADFRLCIDFKQLNAATVDFIYPLADPRTLLESLSGQKYFATLDLRQGFHQVLMDQSSAAFTAFGTKSGTYRYTRLPFGVKNGPRYFQKVITDVLRPHLSNACEVFIDDVVVFGPTLNKFMENLESVFKTLLAANFRLKRSKCVLLSHKVEYLGYIVDGTGISLSDARKQGIIDMKPPTTRKLLRTFLGMANFFRSFVPKYGIVAAPLYSLVSPSLLLIVMCT